MGRNQPVGFEEIQRQAMKGAKIPVTKNKGAIKKLVILVVILIILGLWKFVDIVIYLINLI